MIMTDKKRKYSIFDHMGKFNSIRTICDVHRQTLRKIESLNLPEKEKEEIIDLIADAYDMAKRMGDKLVYYHKKINPDKKSKWYENFF